MEFSFDSLITSNDYVLNNCRIFLIHGKLLKVLGVKCRVFITFQMIKGKNQVCVTVRVCVMYFHMQKEREAR